MTSPRSRTPSRSLCNKLSLGSPSWASPCRRSGAPYSTISASSETRLPNYHFNLDDDNEIAAAKGIKLLLAFLPDQLDIYLDDLVEDEAVYKQLLEAVLTYDEGVAQAEKEADLGLCHPIAFKGVSLLAEPTPLTLALRVDTSGSIPRHEPLTIRRLGRAGRWTRNPSPSGRLFSHARLPCIQ